MTTRVINCKGGHEKYDVYIGRRIVWHPEIYPHSKWANPFKIGKDGTREEVITKFRQYILTRPDLLAAIPTELKGKTLGCWCKPDACHGDVYVELADGMEKSKKT